MRQVILEEIKIYVEKLKEAIEKWEEGSFDLILMDIHMPEMDGFEVARHIRGNQETQGIPIIAVTALTAFKDKQKCFESGCNEYIPKPMIPTKLASTVEKLLNSPPAEELGKQ